MAIALVLAAGRGERLGTDGPKALAGLHGRALMTWSIEVLAAAPSIEQIVVALPPGVPAPEGVLGVLGGQVRSQSVRLALAAARPGGPILVHDAARPLLTVELVEAVIAAVQGSDLAGAIAAAPVTDTIKRARESGTDGEIESPIVSETLDRSTLWAVQTPQVFAREALTRALDAPLSVLAQATDDAWLVERAGGRIAVVASTPENLKVTTPIDLRLAEMILTERRLGQP